MENEMGKTSNTYIGEMKNMGQSFDHEMWRE
jgi:hypothetical protein